MENSSPRVLIVDDIPDTVQLLRDWLEAHEFNTLGVTSSTKALQLAEDEQPDLILLDVMMPKMDGMETCRRLKANPKTAHIPVILVTAKNPSDARSEGMLAGAIDYITKPINLQDLVGRIESALAASPNSPVDVQRLLEEVVHSALTILASEMVWLLALEPGEDYLVSRIIATSSGSRAETDFLVTAAGGGTTPRYALKDAENPFVKALLNRTMVPNIEVDKLSESPSTAPLHKAAEKLRLSYLTAVPLIAAGKTSGLMVLGGYQPHNMESYRARQIVSSLGSQAAIAVDYSRVMTDLTEREQEMKRQEAFRQMILDTMSDGLVVIDSSGGMKYMNRRLLRMTQYTSDYLENRSVGELFHPDDRLEVLNGLLREGAATMKFDQRLVTKNQEIIPVRLSRSRAQADDRNNQVIVLSDMTDQKERETELERQTGRLEALNRAAHVIASDLSLHDTLQNILDSAVDVVEAQGASLFLVNKDNSEELIAVAAVGLSAKIMEGLRVPVGQGVVGWVARHAESQLVRDTAKDTRFYMGVDEKTGLQTRSLVAVPLLLGEQVIGVLEVVNKLNDGLFDDGDVNLLESMAGSAAVSVMNARLFDQSQRRVKELGTLLNASEAASSTLQFSQVLENIVRNLSAGLEVDRCSILAWNPDKNRLESLAQLTDSHWAPENAPSMQLKDHMLISRVLNRGERMLISLADTDLDRVARATLEAQGMVSRVLIPIRSGEQVIGAVELFSNNPQFMYSEIELKAIDALLELKLGGLEQGMKLTQLDQEALKMLAFQLKQVGSTDVVVLWSWEPDSDTAKVVRELGFSEWTRRSGTIYPTEIYRTMGEVIEGQTLCMGTVDDLDKDGAEKDWIVSRGGHSFLFLPLIQHGVTIGLVKLIAYHHRVFDEDEVRLAQGIASVVSNAMENARLFQSVQSRAKALESAYQDLQEADRAKDQFIQNVSHELRTPLISVLGYSGLMADNAFGELNDEMRDAVNEIVAKAQKLTNIVQDIVSLQSLDMADLQREEIDLLALTREVIESQHPAAANAGLELIANLPETLPPVLANRETVIEVFDKLLDNAFKFGVDGKKVEVSLQDVDGPMVQVNIRDYGVGIDSSEHQKVFRRFYQVDGASTRRFGGTGLGLARVKAIVDGHGGRITIDSALNEGATFSFTLPKYERAVNGG
ncbi:MAG: GAF domain-containing protein [Anaerolineaceae bacterium]|nr:GAF domain-containing protein [Anaerolineaceae bacterium]